MSHEFFKTYTLAMISHDSKRASKVSGYFARLACAEYEAMRSTKAISAVSIMVVALITLPAITTSIFA